MSGILNTIRKKTLPKSCSVVVVAAGSARRMEGIDKIMTKLGELPVLVHTLYAFQDCDCFDEIIVVTREDLLADISSLCAEYKLDKVRKVVVGGAERTHSVRRGLAEVRPDAELIAIHDGARPLVPQKILEKTVAQAARSGAAAPGIPVTDTIKQTEDGQTTGTLDRSKLFAVQTPQIFQAGLIKAAVEKAIADGEVLTDDSACVERLGMKVTITEGSRENIKITTPFDLLLGTAILENRVKEGKS